MRTPYTCPFARSLPLVLAAVAMACSANDEPGRSTPEFNGAVPENTGRGSDVADGSATREETIDEDTSPINDVGRSDANANDDANRGVSAGPDSDNDGLPDSVETNTRVFRSKNDTGTDPRNADTDDDGISDGDEVLGTAKGLDLPKLGTNPLHRDILIEYDWFEDSKACAAHSHHPTLAAMNRVAETFAAAPVNNPDGKPGIKIIQDYGQGGLFNGGNLIVDENGDNVITNAVDGPEFDHYEAKHFAANRNGYFHYALMAHRYTYKDPNTGKQIDTDSSGYARLPGYRLIVTLNCYSRGDFDVASTIVHELGHNLHLRHGGRSDLPNYKPNYNSVMNYLYQWDGVDTNCTPPGDQVIDYSRNRRISLDERALDENKGMCRVDPPTPVDWNGNQRYEPSLSFDLNGDNLKGVLDDHDDWSAIDLNWRRASSLEKRDAIPDEGVVCESHPPSN